MNNRIEEIGDALNEKNDIKCISACDGIMEFNDNSDTWICNQCGLELGEDDIMEEVEEQECELWID